MDKPVFVDYETKICSNFCNAVSDTVWDALGQSKTPQEALRFIGAVGKTSDTGTALIPAGTEAQRDPTPQLGAIRFSSTAVGWEGWNGTNWVAIGGGQMYGQALIKGIFYNAISIAENVTIKAGTNGLSGGPIQVENGFTVTVEPGSTWTVT